MFLDYKNYSHLLINNGNGGFITLKQTKLVARNKIQNASIYYRFGKSGTKLENFRDNKTTESDTDNSENDDEDDSAPTEMSICSHWNDLNSLIEKYEKLSLNAISIQDLRKLMSEN